MPEGRGEPAVPGDSSGAGGSGFRSPPEQSGLGARNVPPSAPRSWASLAQRPRTAPGPAQPSAARSRPPQMGHAPFRSNGHHSLCPLRWSRLSCGPRSGLAPCPPHRGNVKCHWLTIPEVAVGDDRQHRRLSRFRLRFWLRFASLCPLPRFDSIHLRARMRKLLPVRSARIGGTTRWSGPTFDGHWVFSRQPDQGPLRVWTGSPLSTHCARANRSESA